MKTAEEYVREVGARLPRWYPGRERVLEDLRLHLRDRVAAGEDEGDVVGGMESAEAYAAELTEGIDLNPASLGRRIGAFAIDLLVGVPILLMVAAIQSVIFNLQWAAPSTPPSQWGGLSTGEWLLMGVVAYPVAGITFLSVIYFPIVEAFFGTTVGKHLLGLGVVAQNGTRVGLSTAYLRRVPFIFQFYFIDSIFAFFSTTRQRAFDRVARTLVVTYPIAMRG